MLVTAFSVQAKVSLYMEMQTLFIQAIETLDTTTAAWVRMNHNLFLRETEYFLDKTCIDKLYKEEINWLKKVLQTKTRIDNELQLIRIAESESCRRRREPRNW